MTLFTGLVENTAKIMSLSSSQLTVRVNKDGGGEDRLGDSISINGACLTVSGISGDDISFDISHETLDKTNLGELRPGSFVNLERSLKVGDRLHGHFVTGHVDTVAKVKDIIKKGKYWDLIVRLEEGEGSFSRWAAGKGSICINGISLTINEVFKPFTIKLTLVPHTLSKTNLIKLALGDKVNVEFDILSKYLENIMGGRNDHKGSVTEERLRELGYVR